MNQNELVLITGDLFIPSKIEAIHEEVKSILKTGKFNYVLATGNIGDKESQDYLKSLSINSSNFYSVKGEIDTDRPETQVVKIGEFDIGIINGFQVVPWGDPAALASIQRKLNCDILIHGYTSVNSFQNYEGKYYINPGSLTGSYSPLVVDANPSFVFLVINGDVGIVYLYELNSGSKKFDISKFEITKNKSE